MYLKAKCELWNPFSITSTRRTCEQLEEFGSSFLKLPALPLSRLLWSIFPLARLLCCWLSCVKPLPDIEPLGLAPPFNIKASKGQKRAAVIVFAKSLILTMRKMQQSKYKEVTEAICRSWIFKIANINEKVILYIFKSLMLSIWGKREKIR